jgi:non-specific serine/threonine protein kinase
VFGSDIGLLERDLPPGVQLADLGVYRLRDLPTPERLFQVNYAGAAETVFPPLRAEAGYASNLPVSFTRFFGREPEIGQLCDLLLDSGTRLVTLSGPGGTGKTRLALEVASRLVPSFSGAVWFVSLADLSDAALIGDALVGALRLPRTPGREPLEQAIEALSKQPSLLVLDNFEQLVEAGAGVVRTLLERVPDLTILVTSRQLLGLSGEREFALSPLPTPGGAADTPERLSLYGSVQLFVDRAQAVKPDFQVTNANAPAVAELCDRLEGIPLAIELAAARAQVLTPAQMLAQLQNRFAFLVSRKRDVAERHRTLRAAIDWSFRLLSPELQRFFARLSVFRGGWTVEAAEQVCEEPLALDHLAVLRECSLVRTDDGSGSNEIRFGMLETLREFGQERLRETGEEWVLHKRHLDYFARFSQDSKKHLFGPEQKQWLDRYEHELDNMRSALEAALTDVGDPDSGLRLALGYDRFWQVRGYVSEARGWLKRLLGCANALSEESRAKALYAAGFFALRQGDNPEARVLLEESLSAFRERGDTSFIARAADNLALVLQDQGDFEGRGRCMRRAWRFTES